MCGNLQLEKIVEKAEEWVGKVEWMAMVNGELEAEQGRLISRVQPGTCIWLVTCIKRN